MAPKPLRGIRAPPIVFTAHEQPQFSFLHRLPHFVAHRAGSASCEFLFNPLASDRSSFKNVPFTSTAVGKTVRNHLEAAGFYGGGSAHGFRRGAMQAAAAQGASRVDLGLQAQIKTAAVVERYISTTRHQPRLERHKRSHAAMQGL